MRTPRRDGAETRSRIIEAASVVFAAAGFRLGTVAQIAELAGVNHAAVNYHFGGKEELYRRVWIHAREVCLQAYPLKPRGPDERSTENALRSFIRSLVLRSFDDGPAGHLTRLIAFEITDPLDHIADLRLETMRMHASRLDEIVSAVLGPAAIPNTLQLCRLSILSPTVGLGVRMVRHAEQPQVARLRKSDPEQLADGVFRFAWAGLQDLKRNRSRSDHRTVKEEHK
ncbi:MAG: TetR/AcrR family transcriptional regulator [Candidatus Eisenbacteria sp.]|nr:TetR/AcrR family transcriptional regulator [Candidatus Eisenbacteria bacterium]